MTHEHQANLPHLQGFGPATAEQDAKTQGQGEATGGSAEGCRAE